jgi:hypothetical protein
MAPRAYVFSCSGCGDESKRFIGYLEMYTPQAKAALEHPQPDANLLASTVDIYEQGRMIRGENTAWVRADSDKAFELLDTIMSRCGDDPPKSCSPGDK